MAGGGSGPGISHTPHRTPAPSVQTAKYAKRAAGERLTGDYSKGFLTTGLFRYSRHPNFFAGAPLPPLLQLPISPAPAPTTPIHAPAPCGPLPPLSALHVAPGLHAVLCALLHGLHQGKIIRTGRSLDDVRDVTLQLSSTFQPHLMSRVCPVLPPLAVFEQNCSL